MLSPSKSLLAAALLLVATFSFSQPVNDDCAGAVLLTVGANTSCDNTEAGTTIDANYSGTDFCNTPHPDVWYKFVATANAHTVSISNALDISNNGVYALVEIFSGDCSNLNHSFCSFAQYLNSSVSFGDLTPGETYFIRVVSQYSQAFNFDICVSTPPAPPANDACAGAISLNVDPDDVCDVATGGSTQDGTTSPVPICSDCYGADDDVWYSFTATQSNHFIGLTNIASMDNSWYGSTNVFSGACGNLTYLKGAFFYGSGGFVVTNLTPGESYYIRVFSNINDPTPITFDICVTSPPPPPNDECAGAILVSPSLGFDCSSGFSGSLYGATPSGMNCQGVATNDIWYQFTATSVSHAFEVYPNFNLLFGFELYGGDCNSLTSLACTVDYNSITLVTNLTVGATYYLRVFSQPPSSDIFDFNVCIYTLPLPPANDECEGAQSLPVNADFSCNLQTNGSTLGATSSAQNCLGNSETHDVWYSFVAASPTHRLEVYPGVTIFGNYFKFGYEVYSGDCNGLVSLTCKSLSNNFGPSILSGLTPGATYYVRVYSEYGNGHGFSVCVQTLPPPPANEECVAAEVLTPAPTSACTTLTPGSTAGVLTESPSTCYYGSGTGVWYTFTAASASHVARVSDVQLLYGSYDHWLEVYEGTDCNNLTYRECSIYPSVYFINNLTVGQTYYLRWVSAPASAHSFNICIGTLPVPTNDECVNAATLPVDGDLNCDNFTSGTTGGSTFEPSNTCFNSGDVWYSFTATQAAHHVYFNNVVDIEFGYAQPLSVEVLANNCGDFNELYCFQGNFSGNGTLIVGDLVAGETYCLRIGAYYSTPVNFDICVLTPPPPPDNDACFNAVELISEPGNTCTTATSGTTQDATPSPGVEPVCCGNGDVWYSFNATQANHTIFISNVTNIYGYADFAYAEVYTSACNNSSLYAQRFVYESTDWHLTNLEIGTTYYVRIFPNIAGWPINFNICVSSPLPPVNDECAGALPLPISEDLTCATTLVASTLGATQSLPTCNGNPSNDIWYQFTATEATYRFDAGIYDGSIAEWGYEIFSGDCANLTSIRCEQTYYHYPATQGGFVPGETYYIRLFSLQNNVQEITFCTRPIPPPPANDECAEAYSLTVDADISCDATTQGSTLGATQSQSSCYGGASQDIWYSFTATNVSHLLQIVATNTYYGGIYDLGFQVFSGDCDNLNSVLCQGYLFQNDFILQNLTPGETYFVRVYSQNDAAHEFNLCVMTLPPPPANDECANATPVLPNDGLTCDLTYPGTTLGATFDPQFSYSPDVWFSFTATSNSHLFDLLNLNTVLGNPNALNFDVYQGNDCNALNLLANLTAGNTNLLNYLQPGQTYHIRVYPNDPNSAYTFDLCIKSLPPSPPNEDCTGAFMLTPNEDLDCDIVTSGTTAGAINSSGYNCGYGNDVWYQFTAISPTHWVQANNISSVLVNGGFWVEVLQSPDCANFYQLACTYFDQPIYLTGLITGETYYVKAISEYGTAHSFDLCIRTVPPPPNDLCANAVSLDVSSEQTCDANVSGTTTGSGSSPGLSPCGFDGNDVWYSFTATQGSHTVLINNVIDSEGGYATYFGAEVYGGACGSLQNVACRSNLYYSDQFTVGELTAGEVYYIRVFSYYTSGATFNICVGTPPPPPANDACANAVTLPVSSGETCDTQTSGNLEGATPSPVQPYYGYGILYNDVWYTFTATQANHILTLNDFEAPNIFLVAEVLTGSCGSFNTLAQLNAYYGNELTITNLTPGETYHVRVYDGGNQSANFEICVSSIPAPPNDECAGALPLDVNPDLSCSVVNTISTYGATQSAPSCYGNTVNDVWFQFTAASTSQRLNFNPPGSPYSYFSFGVEVFEGSCGALNPILPCLEYYYYNTASYTLQNLTAGQTYYVRLYVFPGYFQDYDICIQTLPEPPANDECAGAATIQANAGLTCDVTYNGSTLGATQSATSCNGNNTHDVWYQFTAASVSQLVDFQYNNSIFSNFDGFLGIEIYAGDGCGNLSSLQCYDYTPGSPITLGGLTVGDTYFIRVFSQYNSAHEFSLCIQTLPPPPANDGCANAQIVTPNEGLDCTNPVAGTTAGVLTYDYFGCQSGPDVWYQFTATNNIHIIELQNVVNQYGSSFLSLELYQGVNCFLLSGIACSYGQYQIYAPYLTAGESYYIRVVGAQGSGTDFNLCVLTILPPANDECAGAIPLPVSSTATCETTLHGATLGATQSNVPVGCSFGSDIWYSFVATSTDHTVNIYNVNGGIYYDLIYEVFSGNCDELTSLGCYSAYTLAAFNNLTPGDTYYARVGTYTQNIFDFDICIGLSLPNLAPVYLAVNADYCGLGNNETVQAVFYNQGTAPVPAGAAVYNLSVSGANNGNYGPLTNSDEIPPGLYGYVEFAGVDLSNPGYNQLVVTGTAPGDPSYEESGLGFNGLPLLTLYYDVDGDGYGDPNNFIVDCYQYEWLVTNGDDCNDYDFYVNPAASEFCNGYDDNCDGLVDAADPNVIDVIPPSVICPPDTILSNDSGECFALLTHNVMSAWDDCSFTVAQIDGIESGGAFPIGTSVVTYQVTDPGNNQATCSFTVEVQKTADPDLLYAYTVISFKDLTMKRNTVESGGVGVVNANKKATLEQNTEVTAANTFVKAPVLDLSNNSNVTTYYQGQVASGILPSFQPNNNPGNNNVTIPNNSTPVVLSLGNYGKITVGNNVTITFSGHNVVRVKELALGNNVTVLFAQNTEVLVDKKVDIGKDVTVNPGNGFAVQFFAEGNVTIEKGCDISANLYTEKNLDLKKATANKPTYMTGLFIADKVNSEEHVHWNWDETYCSQGGQNRTTGGQVVEKQEVLTILPGKLLLAPNPASDEVQVIFNWETECEATLLLYDAAGRLARTEQLAVVIGENRYRLDLASLPEGMYTLQISTGEHRAIEKLIIVK